MTKQTQTLIKSALILTLAGIIAKVISAFYKVPLQMLTGTVGLGYYTAVYPIYSLLTAAALIGIPNSVSKLVAEELAHNEYNKAHQTFRISFIMTVTMGVILSGIFFLFRFQMIEFFEWDGSLYALMGLSIAPLFISISGAVRGYMQGMQNMIHSGVSQIIENLFKVLIGISLVFFLKNEGYTVSQQIGGAALGVSLGLFLSAVYLSGVYLRKRKDIKAHIEAHDKEVNYSKKEIAKKIGYLAIPVTIASAAYSIMTFIDTATLPRLLTDPVIVDGMKVIADGKTVNVGMYSMGILGKVQTIVNVPLVISVSLIISVVPSISAANAKKNQGELVAKIREATEIAAKLAMPAAMGIFVLADPLLNLVYLGDVEGAVYLQGYAVCLVFMILSQSLIGVLQGLGSYYKALAVVLGAAVTKLIINYAALSLGYEAFSAIIGTLGYYVFIALTCYVMIRRLTQFTQPYAHAYLKPLIASGVMGIIVYFSYELVHNLLNSNTIATLFSVLLGMLSYGIVMVLLKAFTRDEIMIVPKHEKILPWLEKHNLI